jgi:hypothetical protein
VYEQKQCLDKTEKSVAALLNQQQEPELKGESSMSEYVTESVVGSMPTDAELLTLICDRFALVDASTGDHVWTPKAGAEPEELRRVLRHWFYGAHVVRIDTANPLSYLLIECVCNPRRVVNCPVHGPSRKGRLPFRTRRSVAEARRRHVAEIVAREGTQDRAAKVLGISRQRVSQILYGRRRYTRRDAQ